MKKIMLVFLVLTLILVSCSKPATPTAPPPPPTQAATAVVEPPTPAPTPYEIVTVKINSAKLTSYAPIFIAEKEGYFEEFGIKLDKVTFNRSSEALPLLAAGELDIYAGIVNSGLLNVLSAEPNVKVVADRGSISTTDSCTYVGIMVRKDLFDNGTIKSPADLKGQTIAATTAGSTGYLLSEYLSQAGLTFDDVTLSDLPTANYVDGFANKSVAAIVAPELHVTRLEKAGNSVVIAGQEDFNAEQLSVMVFGKSLTVDHPDVAARFLAAYLKGIQKYNEGKTDSNIQAIVDATGEDIELIKDSCWIPIREDGSIDFAGIDAFQKWSIEQKQLDAAVTEEQFWDPSFLAAAKKLLE
jgi:NitT/TauT family transport system substrate-binding protein